MKKRIVQIFVWLSLVTSWTMAQSHMNAYGKSVTLNADCIDGRNLQLKLKNQTEWSLGVSTFSTYYHPKKYRSLRLPTGVSVYAMPNDKIISSLYYSVERELERRSDGKQRFEVSGTSSGSGDTSWIPARDFVIFQVPIDDLPAKSRVFVKFNYDWELIGGTHFSYGGIEHRVYYEAAVKNGKFDLPACRG